MIIGDAFWVAASKTFRQLCSGQIPHQTKRKMDFAHQKTDLLKQKAVSATAGNTGCIKRIHFLKAAS